MKRITRVLFCAAAMTLFAGCSIGNVPLFSNPEPTKKVLSPADQPIGEPQESEQSKESETSSQPTPPKFVCKNASKTLLKEMAVIVNAHQSWFVKGKTVRIDDQWIAVAIESVVPPESGFDPDYNGGTRTFITGDQGSVESNSGLGPDDIEIQWGGLAIAKAEECLKR